MSATEDHRLDGSTEADVPSRMTPDDLALPVTTRRTIHRYDAGQWTDVPDAVVTEFALTIYVNDNELATVVCTPAHMEDLVVGFLASEGIIRSLDQLLDVQISTFRGSARVRTTTDVTFNQAFYNKRYIASCCGKSRQSFYFYNDAHTARPVEDDLRIDAPAVIRLMAAMEAQADVFRSTGGVHMACLCDTEGVRLARADIGRHNALDKLYGHLLRTRGDLAGTLVAFSGRLSSEVLLKVAKLGCAVVLAKSAPTALALDMAEELGITAIGFARGQMFNVYTHPERVCR